MLKETMRAAWAEVDLSAIRHNINEVKKRAQSKEIFGIVKADGYGCGAVEVANVLLEEGVSALGVAVLSEAVALRQGGITCPIILLGITPAFYHEVLFDYDLLPVMVSYEESRLLSEMAVSRGRTIEIFLAVETGMGRIGMLPNQESVEAVVQISKLPNIRIKGLFSHFATADEKDKAYSQSQIQKFEAFQNDVAKAGVELPYRTLANSAAVMELPQAHYNAVRPGIVLYGQYPSNEVDRSILDLRPAMTLKANIVFLKKVPPGFSVSYGRKFTTEKESVIATLPLGYADGYPRFLSGKGRVLVRGEYAPVVGNICMDQCMIDVTHIPGVKLYDEVVLMGSQGDKSITADEIGEKTGTINYEIYTRIGKRIPRVYLNK